MNSYHFIGVGLMSRKLAGMVTDTKLVAEQVTGLIIDSGLQIVSQAGTNFEGGGDTLIWILAESHLVLHLWTSEGFATIDLHICDYQASNLTRATHLKESLNEFCFNSEHVYWQELTLPQPERAAG
jgi:S-adenosylmethionine/arginine decarboxylase-like enzyme